MLNEPWDNPRPPTRVWRLFEGYTPLAKQGQLEVVLGPKQQLNLQLSLAERFGELEARVGNIDAHLAEATVEEDRKQIFASIAQLEGGFTDLNEQMQRAQREWLAASAEGVLQRADPQREPLGLEEMELEVGNIGKVNLYSRRFCICCCPVPPGAGRTRLLERWPWLLALLLVLGCIALLGQVGFDGKIVSLAGGLQADNFGIEAGAGADHSAQDPYLLASAGCGVAAVLLVLLGLLVQKHQRQRQLRQPPLFGVWAVRYRRAVIAAPALLSGVSCPLVVRFGIPWSSADEDAVLAVVTLLRAAPGVNRHVFRGVTAEI